MLWVAALPRSGRAGLLRAPTPFPALPEPGPPAVASLAHRLPTPWSRQAGKTPLELVRSVAPRPPTALAAAGAAAGVAVAAAAAAAAAAARECEQSGRWSRAEVGAEARARACELAVEQYLALTVGDIVVVVHVSGPLHRSGPGGRRAGGGPSRSRGRRLAQQGGS